MIASRALSGVWATRSSSAFMLVSFLYCPMMWPNDDRSIPVWRTTLFVRQGEKVNYTVVGYMCRSCTMPPLRSTMSMVTCSKRNTLPPYVLVKAWASASLAKEPTVGPMDPSRLLPTT